MSAIFLCGYDRSSDVICAILHLLIRSIVEGFVEMWPYVFMVPIVEK